MKKTAFAIVLLFVSALLLCCCSGGDSLKIYVPDGAPALAVASVIDSKTIGGFRAETAISTGEDVKAKCESGQADIAVVPTTAAVRICALRGDYAMFSVNVWGLLYVVGSENVSSLSQLQGKTLSSIGMGDTGEYIFKKILAEKSVPFGVSDGVDIRYVADGTTAVNELLAGKSSFALVGEPLATNAIAKASQKGKTLYRVFDLQSLWQEVSSSENNGYPQACVIVKKSLLEKNGFADALFSALESNSDFLAENSERLNGILQSAGSLLSVSYTPEIIARCNIRAEKACAEKADVSAYLQQFGSVFAPYLSDGIYYDF